MRHIIFVFCYLMPIIYSKENPNLPLVINTWNFQLSTQTAWNALYVKHRSVIDAVIEGCTACEVAQCDFTVGYGGSPDENGETTLDAMIMDGRTMNIGAVAGLRRIKNAIQVARHVLENTEHTLIVGDHATNFAIAMGLREESLSTPVSTKMWTDWHSNHCQPNYWRNVVPEPTMECGPYEPVSANDINGFVAYDNQTIGYQNHDTIGMIAIDETGNIAAGTSTNGLKHKIPGRVGDSPIPGSGAYADNEIGAAAATGDGDVMMRFLPAFHAVQLLGAGKVPKVAAQEAISRIVKRYPKFMGAIVVAKNDGRYAAACHGIPEFPYSVFTKKAGNVVERVKCI